MVFLIDSSIYIFRAWQTLSSTTRNRFGEPDNAVQGFTETLCHIIETHRPEYILCAFDECFRQGVRNKLFPEYKAGRPPAPADLIPQFNRCKQVAQILGLSTLGSANVEADDIIGHFAAKAQAKNLPITIVSGDKDLVQFVSANDLYWDLGRQPIATYKDLNKRFKVRPEQIADWLALAGDKSDNIPGVPGVGPTTAARLLNKWDNLDNLLANLGDVAMMKFRGAPRVSRLLYENKANIAFSRSLTGLIQDSALPDDINICLRNTRKNNDIQKELIAMGFDTGLSQRIAQRTGSTNEPAYT